MNNTLRNIFSVLTLITMIAAIAQPLMPLAPSMEKAVADIGVNPPSPPINMTEPDEPYGKQPSEPGKLPPQLVDEEEKPQPINVIIKPPKTATEEAGDGQGVADLEIVKPSITMDAEKSTLVEKARTYRVHLITGDVVFVTELDDGRIAVSVKPADPARTFRVFKAGEAIYVIPADVDLSKFSIDLFNVKLLSKYYELGLRELPVIVKIKETVSIEKSSIESSLPGIASLNYIPLEIINSIAVRIPFEKLAEVYQDLNKDVVVAVQLDRIIKPLVVDEIGIVKPETHESVPYIGAPLLWSQGINGTGVKIAILDTGIDPTHPDFTIGNETKIVAIASFVDFDFDGVPDEPPTDGHGHGTHVAGIAAGVGGYLEILKGVAPGAQLLVAKVLSDRGYGYGSWIIAGIEWAIQNGAQVISMSLGGLPTWGWDPLVEAVARAHKAGVLVVVAAGNEGPEPFTIASPGVTPEALTVGAVDKTGKIAQFSSRGPAVNYTLKPDVVAPGVNIAAARANNTYMGMPASMYHVYASGTSMATPHVSGFAALTLQLLNETGLLYDLIRLSNLTVSDILKDVIISTTTSLGDDPYTYGAGIINATKLFTLVNESSLILVHPARTDIVLYGNESILVALKLYNPWSKNITLTLKPRFHISPYTAAETIPPEAIKIPANITIPANTGVAISIAINGSMIPIGFHALRIDFLNGNKTVATALMGVTKAAIIVLNVTYNGTPVEAAALALGIHYTGSIVSHGMSWEPWVMGGIIYNYGNGTIVLYPVYPDTFYLIDVWTWLPTENGVYVPTEYISMVPVHANSTTTIITHSIELANLKKVQFYTPYNTTLTIDYAANLTLYNGTTQLASLLFIVGWYMERLAGWNTTIYIDIPVSTAVIANVNATLVPSHFSVTGYMQPGQELYSFDISRPIDVFHRAYNSIPAGAIININPVNFTIEMLHVHAAITEHVERVGGSLDIACGPSPLAWGPWYAAYTGSQTLFRIDTNSEYCTGVAYNWLWTGYVDIFAVDFYGYDVGGKIAYSPLRMPRGSTVWTSLYGYTGLDSYNFTGSFTSAHLLRTTLLGYFEIWSWAYDQPLAYMSVALDCNYTIATSSLGSYLRFIHHWYGHNRTGSPSLCVSTVLASHLLAYSNISFASNAVYMDVYVETNKTYADHVTLWAMWYGVGVREIVPLTGYDLVRNMLLPNTTSIIAIIFNMPAPSPFELEQDKVNISLIAGNTTIPLPVLAWDWFGPLPLAYVAIDTSTIPPGAYGLRIELSYLDAQDEARVKAVYVIDPAFYVAVPAGKPGPTTPIKVGPWGSGADFTSIKEAVAYAAPGSTIQILPGVYREELIVIDKPLSITGLGSPSDVKIVPPSGYPVFIVLSNVTISNITIAVEEGQLASVPRDYYVVPTETLIPPSAIIVYHGSIKASNIIVDRFPRGISAYGSIVEVYNLTAVLDSFYLFDNQYVETREPAPVYVYGAKLAIMQGIYSTTIPVIRKTPWYSIGLADVYVMGTPVVILKNDTMVTIGPEDAAYAIIAIGPQVVLHDTSVGIVEIIADNTLVDSTLMSRLLVSSGAVELRNSTAEFARLEAGNILVAGTNITGSLVSLNTLLMQVTDSTLYGGVAVVAEPLANITIANSVLGQAHPAALYVMLPDGAILDVTHNDICCSYYGIYVVPVYTEIAPSVIIANNTFTDVVVPVHIAMGMPLGLLLEYGSAELAAERMVANRPLYTHTQVYQFYDPLATKVYIISNKFINATKAVSMNGFISASIVGNIISASSTGIELDAVYKALVSFNNITAPMAIRLSNTGSTIVFNNIAGNMVIGNFSGAYIIYNYVDGEIIADDTVELVSQPQLLKPVRIPATNKLVIPLPEYIGKLVVGVSVKLPIHFINPTPWPTIFQYSITTRGALEVSGETYTTIPLNLDGLGYGFDTIIADIYVEALGAGSAALVVNIVTDTSYTVEIPVQIEAAKINMTLSMPEKIPRGEIFNVTVIIESTGNGTYLLQLGQEGEGAIEFCLDAACIAAVSSMFTTIDVTAGNNTITILARGLSSGTVRVEAVIYIGLVTITASAETTIEPNPQMAPDAIVYGYPSSLEQGEYDSILLMIDNVTLATRLRIEAVSLNGYIDVLRSNYSITAYWSPWFTAIPIYAYAPGKDTVVIRVYDVDDNVVILNTTIEIEVTPGYVYGYQVIYGYLSTTLTASNGTLTLPDTTAWADLLAVVTVSQAVTSLKSLENMLEVPWGCVEQTTSPLLAAIQVYEYIDKNNLWQDAASALGMNVTELKNWIINNITAYGVERLLEYHGEHCANPSLDACGYGWYPGLEIDLFYTPYGLLGLLRAYEFQQTYNVTLYNDTARWVTTIEKLIHGLIKAQNSDGSWGEYEEDKIYYTSFALYSLVEAYRLGFKPYNASITLLEQSIANATSFIEKRLADALKVPNEPGPVIALLYALAAAGSAGFTVNTTLVAEAVNYLNTYYDGRTAEYIWWSGWWPLYILQSFLYLATAKAALALYYSSTITANETSSLAWNLAVNAARYLATNLEWMETSNTFEAAAVLEAINELGLQIEFMYGQTGNITYTLRAGGPDGQILLNATIPVTVDYWYCYIPDLTSVTAASIWCYQYDYLYEGDWLNITKTFYVELRLEGNATASWLTDTVYKYIPVVGGQTNTTSTGIRMGVYVVSKEGIIVVKQQATNTTPTSAAEYIEITKTVSPAAVLPNSTVTVTLVVKSKNGTLDYIIIYDPLPEGFELINWSVSPPGAAAFDDEFYREKNGTAVGFAIATLNETGVVISYQLRVPSNLTIGDIITFPQANATFFYIPVGETIEPATSGQPTISIGVPLSIAAETIYYGRAALTNGTEVRWGEILNLTFNIPLPAETLATLRGKIVIRDENLTVVSERAVNLTRGWALIVTSALANLSELARLVNTTVYITIVVEDEQGNVLAEKTIRIRLPTVKASDLDDVLDVLRVFWLLNRREPWFKEIYGDLLDGIRYIWALYRLQS